MILGILVSTKQFEKKLKIHAAAFVPQHPWVDIVCAMLVVCSPPSLPPSRLLLSYCSSSYSYSTSSVVVIVHLFS